MSSISSNDTAAVGVPWAGLPLDMCGLVVDRLDSMSALKFPAVCTDWSTACKESSPHLRSGSPTMLTSCPGGDGGGYSVYDYEDGVFAMHDVSTGKSFPAEAEGLRDRCWVGGKDDWLVTTSADCAVELLNPITGVRCRLPSFDTIPGVKLNGEFDVLVEGELYPLKLQRVVLCRTPVHRDGYLAVAMLSPNLLAFMRFQDESWTALKNHVAHGWVSRYVDAIVHEGKVIAVSQVGGVYSWEMDGTDGTPQTTGPTVLREPGITLGPQEQKFRLAMSSGGRGKVLLICMYGSTDYWDGRRHQIRRKIYDDQQGSRCFEASDVALCELEDTTSSSSSTWRRVSGIGSHHALFLGANYPFYITVPRGGRAPQDVKANCIYVADMDSSDGAVLDLERRSEEDFGRPLDYSPGESDPFQMPMWFRPTAYLV